MRAKWSGKASLGEEFRNSGPRSNWGCAGGKSNVGRNVAFEVTGRWPLWQSAGSEPDGGC